MTRLPIGPPRAIGGTPIGGTPIPIRPPHTKPTWPPVINPPDPVIPPGTPPVDPGPITVTPVDPNPPKPVEPVPPHGRPGVWSDGWMLFRQQGGAIVVDTSTGSRSVTEVKQVFSDQWVAQSLVNQMLGLLWTGAKATAVEPWPTRVTAQKSSKEKLMGTDLSQDEKLDIFAATMESVAKDVRDIKAALVTYQAEQTEDHWAVAFGLVEEPLGLDVALDVFSPERAALYAVFGRSVINGSRTYARADCVTLASTLTFGTAIDADGQRYLDLCVKYGVDRDVAIYAPLTGLVDPYEGGLGARLERDVAALAGTYKPETLSDGTVVSRWVPLTFEGAYRRLLPSGSGGQAGQGGA